MFIPLNVNTHYSLLRGFAKPKELAEKCKKNNYSGCAIADYNSLAGVVNFSTAFSDLKPVLGIRASIDNIGHANIYAMNLDGWKELLNINYIIHTSDDLQIEPNHLYDLKNCTVLLCGKDSIVDADIFKELAIHLKDKLFVGSDIDGWKALADLNGVRVAATPNILYANKSDKFDQLTLYSSELGITSSEWNNCADARFIDYHKNEYHFPEQDILSAFSKSELDNSVALFSMCDKYSVLDKPRMPEFTCPNGFNDESYLLELCRQGWSKLKHKIDLSRQQEYGDRVKKELQVIQRANLNSYFLIVQDYVNWARNQGWLIGPGRGSAGGCLISYLIGITTIDPIKYSLIFERFYNDGRNTTDKISLPDIDTDFPIQKRDLVKDYIREKYGRDKVAEVATFGSLQGRGALKEVFRVHNVCDQKTADKISKNLPQKDKISDKLEEEQETSIIRWTLNNEPTALKDWVSYDDNKNLIGDYAQYFAQAIRLEHTYKSYGKHASALVLGYKPLKELCPLIAEKKGNELIAGVAYTELEQMGLPKMDILGVAVLDKLMYGNELLKGNQC